ncbi:D-alanyl-D-alanine carboxypeptidase family protein [Leptobacterium flavescens]|uniref:D-alanyl-D-alanine carboxypeptidase family protein n=1 Tax=Leptobacterium flavescens TaxID=472055 RepID=A0A6P0UGR1_9FLAO|nr:M15 family metallopeptidase [Leptobacterium flavescens]NER12434.1 D-alanyl-D-alanine carboxypeptidase family protein [Leptobacterium flavescens]
MKRRKFIKYSSAGTLLINLLPQQLFAMQQFTEEELIGKGTPGLYGDGFQVRKEVYDAFVKMKAAAQKENIDMEVVSGYRDFFRQKAIYERKYKKYTEEGLSPVKSIEKIIEYSTIPGTSRHHWGTDMDIIDARGKHEGDVLIPDKFHGNGPFCKFKEWMDKHSESFGFYLVYTDNGNRKGFKYEPWHYSYKPLSGPMLKEYRKIDIKEMLIKNELLGKEHLSDDFIDRYRRENVLDINPELL